MIKPQDWLIRVGLSSLRRNRKLHLICRIENALSNHLRCLRTIIAQMWFLARLNIGMGHALSNGASNGFQVKSLSNIGIHVVDRLGQLQNLVFTVSLPNSRDGRNNQWVTRVGEIT